MIDFTGVKIIGAPEGWRCHWTPTHSWSIRSQHVDGWLVFWPERGPGREVVSLDFTTPTSLAEYFDGDTHGYVEVLNAWSKQASGDVFSVPFPTDDTYSDPMTILVETMAYIPDVISSLGLQMG